MTVLGIFLIAAHLASGIVCYAASISEVNADLSSIAERRWRALMHLWIPMGWPAWMLGEIWRLNQEAA